MLSAPTEKRDRLGGIDWKEVSRSMARGKTPSAAKGGTSPRGGGKQITVVGFLILEDGSKVPMEDLTPELRDAWEARRCERLSQRMSDYYTRNPDEWGRI